MIRTVDQAVEQNRKIVEECFKVTQKLVETEEELKECKAKLLELEPTVAIIRNRVDEDEALQKLVMTCQELTKRNQEIVKVNRLLDAKTKQYEEAKNSNNEMLKKLEALGEKLQSTEQQLIESKNELKNTELEISLKCQEIEILKQPQQINVEEARAKIAEQNEKDELRLKLKKCEQEMQRRDQSFLQAQHHIRFMTSETARLYLACTALKDENLALRHSPIEAIKQMQYNMAMENLTRDNIQMRNALHEAHLNQLSFKSQKFSGPDVKNQK